MLHSLYRSATTVPAILLAAALVPSRAHAQSDAYPPASRVSPRERVQPYFPEPAFDPGRQCRPGKLTAAPMSANTAATVLRWLPGITGAAIGGSGCLRVTAESAGNARLAELVLRGLEVPRQAARLELATAQAQRS